MTSLIGWARERWRVTLPAAVLLAAAGAWLLFGFFGVHTLFIDEVVDEENPFVAQSAPSGLPADETTEEMADAMNDAMREEGISGDEEVSDSMPADVTVLAQGSFRSRAHDTTGTAKVITDGDRRFLRLEDFETDNGPDLNVYLATGDPEASPGDFIDLGDLKGNIGNQNYELPPDADISTHSTVFIWCVRFSVAFGAAPIAP